MSKLERIRDFLCEVFGGSHHVTWDRFKPQVFEQATYFFHQDCSTFDGDLLTRIVLSAHAHAIRVEIRPGGRYIKLWMSARTRDGLMHERHPTLSGHLARMKESPDRDTLTTEPTP